MARKSLVTILKCSDSQPWRTNRRKWKPSYRKRRWRRSKRLSKAWNLARIRARITLHFCLSQDHKVARKCHQSLVVRALKSNLDRILSYLRALMLQSRLSATSQRKRREVAQATQAGSGWQMVPCQTSLSIALKRLIACLEEAHHEPLDAAIAPRIREDTEMKHWKLTSRSSRTQTFCVCLKLPKISWTDRLTMVQISCIHQPVKTHWLFNLSDQTQPKSQVSSKEPTQKKRTCRSLS